MIPTLPMRPRNRLAELVLSAVTDVDARAELTDLAAAASAPPGWFGDDDIRHGPSLLARARAAMQAIGRRPVSTQPLSREEALEVAAALFDEGLFFEVHEILEPWWRDADGGAREALQGLIQIAVGYQHLANGNLAGAGALLHEGTARLDAGALAPLDLGAFARAVRASVDAPVAPPFPRAA